MSSPLIVVKPKEKVGHIVDLLKTECMCGFPIVETPEDVSNILGRVMGVKVYQIKLKLTL